MRIPQVRAMKTLSGLIVVAVVVGLAGEARPAFAAGPDGQLPAYSAHSTGVRALPGGTIVAFVRDGNGRPVGRRDRHRRRQAHRDRRHRQDGPLRSVVAAGRRLSRARPPRRLSLRPLARRPRDARCGHDVVVPAEAAAGGVPRAGQRRSPSDLRSRHRRRRARAASRAVVGLGRRRRPRRGRVAHSSPEAQRAAGRNRAGDRRRDVGRRLRSGRRGRVQSPEPGRRRDAVRVEPADRLPAQRPGEPAHQQRLRQPDAAHVDEHARARRRAGVARLVGRTPRRLVGAGRDVAG